MKLHGVLHSVSVIQKQSCHCLHGVTATVRLCLTKPLAAMPPLCQMRATLGPGLFCRLFLSWACLRPVGSLAFVTETLIATWLETSQVRVKIREYRCAFSVFFFSFLVSCHAVGVMQDGNVRIMSHFTLLCSDPLSAARGRLSLN